VRTDEGTAWIKAWWAGRDADLLKLAPAERATSVALLDMQAREPIIEELMAKDPRLTPMAALVIAGDLVTLERSKGWVLAGCPAVDAMSFVGSFGRLEFAVWAEEGGHLAREVLLDMLPDLWRGSDPDDTDPRFLALWRAAWMRNGRTAVLDGEALPDGPTLTVYRGQDEGAPMGIAWSLDEEVAQKFARGAGTRQADRPGMVYESSVPRLAVLAYLTGRNESEVILPTLGSDYTVR
jgi:hypothetical protein